MTIRRDDSRGFTLIEVVIAISIVAIMSTLIYGSFTPMLEAKEIVEAEADRYHGIRLSLSRMSREISMAFLSPHYDAKRFTERPTLFVGKDSGDEDTLMFTTMGHERLYVDAKESDQSIVAYRVGDHPDERGKHALFRREKLVIDDRPEDEGTEVVLAEGIDGLELEYWDAVEREWTDEWDTRRVERADALPERVRITLIAPGDDGKPRKFSTQTQLAMTRPLGK